MKGVFMRRLLKIAYIPSLIVIMFATDVSAKTESETEYNSKGTITDESSVNIDSTDIYTLDNAIGANNKTLENYSATAGDIYNNLSAIDSAVSKAKTEIAQNLEDMNIYVSRNDAGAINSHAATTDWVGTTMAAKSAAVSNYTLEELIRQMKTSVTGTGSEMTAKINAGDFKSKKVTSSVASGSQAVKLAGMTEINLDKNQQLVLPSGYYGNGMTINNVISGETLNWNPKEKTTFVIDKPYTGGTISNSNAYDSGVKEGHDAGYKEGHTAGVREGYDSGYKQGKDDAIKSISPSLVKDWDSMDGKMSLSFSTTAGGCYIVDMMLTEYFNADECSISGGEFIERRSCQLSRRNDCWTTNVILLLRAYGGSVTVKLKGSEAPGGGEYDRVSQACVIKCN